MAIAPAEDMRRAARSVAAGVVLVTSFVSDRPWGVTATGFSVIGVEPATVMVSLGRRSALAEAVLERQIFGVSVLTEGALGLADRHALPGSPKFMAAEDRHAESATPVAAHRSVHFDCGLIHSFELADHLVCFGHVTAIVEEAEETSGDPRPLVYCGRSYFALHPTALMGAEKYRATRRIA